MEPANLLVLSLARKPRSPNPLNIVHLSLLHQFSTLATIWMVESSLLFSDSRPLRKLVAMDESQISSINVLVLILDVHLEKTSKH